MSASPYMQVYSIILGGRERSTRKQIYKSISSAKDTSSPESFTNVYFSPHSSGSFAPCHPCHGSCILASRTTRKPCTTQPCSYLHSVTSCIQTYVTKSSKKTERWFSTRGMCPISHRESVNISYAYSHLPAST